MKFGGTSVGTAKNLLNVKRIVEANTDSVIVVVSALGGLTDKLIETARLAEAGDVLFEKNMTEIVDRHNSIITQVIPVGNERDDLLHRVNDLQTALHQHYRDVFASRELSAPKMAAIVSYGERLSSIIVATLIDDARWFDSLSFIKTEYKHHKHKLSGELTDQLIHEKFQKLPKVALVPGFISTDMHTGEITNLGRGGSDYTAAILAAALDADCLEIWTDVDGFMTADPRLIPSASPIKELSYNEAEELCNYGAKVVYPPTIYPVWYKDIPVLIKNTMNPEAPGTYIRHIEQSEGISSADNESKQEYLVTKESSIKGISSVKDTCLITISGVQEKEQAELWRNLSQCLSDECIQVLVSVQHPSEHHLLVGVKKEDTEFACSTLQKTLSAQEALTETQKRYQLEVTTDLSTIAMVGKVAKQSTDILTCLMDNLDKRGVNVFTPCLEHSGLTFAYMVASADLHTALEATHVTAFQQ